MRYTFLIFVCIMAFVFGAKAQAHKADTASVAKKDTFKKASGTAPGSFAPIIKKERVYHPDSTHSPRKAVLRSLIVPGLGQLYNHRWWKLPIIYGGIGLLTSAVIFNNTYYNEFTVLSRYRKNGVAPLPNDKYYAEYLQYTGVPDQNIYDAGDGYRRNRDLSILGILGFWGIQTIDAYIDAKFINAYTVDNNFSIRVVPGIINNPVFAQNTYGSFIPGIKVTFTF